MTESNKEEINKLLDNNDFVNMIRTYLNKKNQKPDNIEVQVENTKNNSPDIKENERKSKSIKTVTIQKRQASSNSENMNREEKKDTEAQKKDETDKSFNMNGNKDINIELGNNDNIDKNNKEALNETLKEEYNNILESFGIKDKLKEHQENLNNDNSQINKDEKNKSKNKSTESLSKNSISSSSSGNNDARHLLRKKRNNKYESEELICKNIYQNKNSSPSLILLSKIIEEFTFGLVLDTLLKSNLNENIKLYSMLRGLIDSEGINKVILMLLKFK